MGQFPRRRDVLFVFTLICFVGGSYYIYVYNIYLRIIVSNMISISDDAREYYIIQ
jgi:glucan phosphoethanolaminetransferase (alkaline phosphatase superfamily)